MTPRGSVTLVVRGIGVYMLAAFLPQAITWILSWIEYKWSIRDAETGSTFGIAIPETPTPNRLFDVFIMCVPLMMAVYLVFFAKSLIRRISREVAGELDGD